MDNFQRHIFSVQFYTFYALCKDTTYKIVWPCIISVLKIVKQNEIFSEPVKVSYTKCKFN